MNAPSPSLDRQYAAKPDAYFAGARADFVARLPSRAGLRVLEIGCGSGDTAALARSTGRIGHYVGVELFPAAAERARAHVDEVLIGDIETMRLPFQPASFDAVILSEVLEHLKEPWDVFQRVGDLLAPGGVALASSPNVTHWRVIRELIAGRFELADRGVFDRTHLRWFTPTTFARMFVDAGLEVREVFPVTPFAARTRMLSRVTGGRIDHLFMAQICVDAVKPA